MPAAATVSLIPVPVDDEIISGDDLAEKLRVAMQHQKLSLENGDILIIKHKVVSKAEGQVVPLAGVNVSPEARRWAREARTDPRLIQLALDESRTVIRKKVIGRRGVLITETRHGFVCANSGVDVSNVDGGKHAVLLPRDPDRSAGRLRTSIRKNFGVNIAVIITDSFGRPWREGLTEVAIGVAGMKPLRDDRGKHDPHGYTLHASAEAIADELACAAGLVCGKLNRTPFCIVRGFKYAPCRGNARELVRKRKNDLFR